MAQDSNLKELHVNRYGVLLPYLAYENTMYWQRGLFFLVANSALLGFTATMLNRTNNAFSDASLLISIAGLVITYYWWQGLRTGEFWIHHWHKVLEQLEEKAFGDVALLRNFTPDPKSPPRVQARPLARGPVILFAAIWALIVIYKVLRELPMMSRPGH